VTMRIANPSRRIAAIDWMRGFVMLLMVVDHASMAFDGQHIAHDSALYPDATTMALPGAAFFTRWMTHLCAPTFIFLAGTALALSVERRVAKGVNGWEIDRGILIRGAIIALMDPTIISLGSGNWTLQVLLAIGLSMMCMAPLRRLPSWALMTFALGWYALGELPTLLVWHPPGSSSIWSALVLATYGNESGIIKYPVLPWLAIMVLGWVFGRHMNNYAAGKTKISPASLMLASGIAALAIFVVVRGMNGYGNMLLPRADNSWQQWLHVSKYPPSITYVSLELGLMCVFMWVMMRLEPLIGVRENGPFLVFGQTAMFFYLIHRLVFEIPATYFGLRGTGTIATTYEATAVMLLVLYPACLWYRSFKAAHPQSILKYF